MFMIERERIDSTVKKVKGQTANFLTLINLSLGALALLFMMNGDLKIGFILIFLAGLFDRFDGMVARMLNIESEFGKQLDSLCDLISFGIAPAFLIYQAVLHQFGVPGIIFTIIFIVCGAIRLARFNITEFTGSFVGVPITVAGCLMAAGYLAINIFPGFFYMFLTIGLAILMISTISIEKR
ncbi:CDP-diacylglycerol--serine O-phosphatidyltransferase [Fictibacillus nanhaiensis]|jgi:CDP-diacylglycerol---serine O-phosphatidyltransferase|uniref:CDP-diacylglycerol--serine O-phosphatidyltransferase n=1 Tax=Fictibacillus nanhaiensis TaxID=742169 RepID=UPI00203F34E3|nr:CDP-diacylglycerol--serine O-phosphatidyltransferase [Fictibacillus nanhaiensis]MCM3730795.1 CDP-diacylglycerol--serine O-phosphatidyltransferase [Fictibacillus nanhaiensis]